MRKLASIRKISEIQPITGADAIELALVDGWKVVTKKGEYKPGDLCIYCEIDSFLPVKEEFEFLRKSSFRKMADGSEGFRLKTIRLKNQISQGLLLPLSLLGDFSLTASEGTEVTELLGITKWEDPIPAELAGKVKGNFPSIIRKTDEIRVQNLTNQWERFKASGKKFYVTEKLDGTSATFYFDDGVFGVCSRNLELLKDENNTYWKVAEKLDLENKFKNLGRNICLQGELIGEGVQGNPYKIIGQTVRFFSAFDIDEQKVLTIEDLINLSNLFKITTVPIIDLDFQLTNSIEDMLLLADSKSILNQKFDREGIVIRSHDSEISFKVISNKFLLKEKC